MNDPNDFIFGGAFIAFCCLSGLALDVPETLRMTGPEVGGSIGLAIILVAQLMGLFRPQNENGGIE